MSQIETFSLILNRGERGKWGGREKGAVLIKKKGAVPIKCLSATVHGR